MRKTSLRPSNPALTKAAGLVCKALPDDATLTSALSVLAARWLDAKPGRMVWDRRGHLRIAPTARKKVETACRDVQWMADPDRHHGQQPAALAEKTLRALRTGRIGWSALIGQCDEFRCLRQAAIRRNAARRPRADAETTVLPSTGAVATRIVTERDLARLGREARNCLAGKEHSRRYRRALRLGEAEFWRLDNENRDLLCVLQIDAENLELDRAEGPDGSGLTPASAAAVLEFLRVRRLTVGDRNNDLVAYGICDEFIQAPGEPDRMEAVLHGTRWTLEFVPGSLLARCTENAAAWLLRAGRGGRAWCKLVELAAAEDDDVCVEDTVPYAYEAKVRTGLRRACRENPALARACAEAFRDAPDVFREDWFDLGQDTSAAEDVA